MFIMYDDYFINTKNINYAKILGETSQVIFYFGTTQDNADGSSVTLQFGDIYEITEFLQSFNETT
ncbi:hypothetical protein [Acinetobacter gyllenbergii]|uniref:hypothetical protein n=1 Tax=Acinetobacter gyllenbergii TaxID=134534 RepID=UPI000806C215|nr:hypothetical protein [Acinetobacter gyllenbergii]OBY75282.1 hypothetical protein NG55_00975 [Acinetobacter gyllenbergii]